MIKMKDGHEICCSESAKIIPTAELIEDVHIIGLKEQDVIAIVIEKDAIFQTILQEVSKMKFTSSYKIILITVSMPIWFILV